VNYAIPIFETTYSKTIAIFAFNNSTFHGIFNFNVFVISYINIRPSGKQSKIKNTVFNS
jgi:hypothetical protein